MEIIDKKYFKYKNRLENIGKKYFKYKNRLEIIGKKHFEYKNRLEIIGNYIIKKSSELFHYFKYILVIHRHKEFVVVFGFIYFIIYEFHCIDSVHL